ncbi:integrase [Klebsiella variicola]|uniref:integrase n=1 Tax=Klebsiella variicola TaxID=244366 RepID=UPI001CCB2619|nr:integrase [Klebsiella variicola]
MFILTQLNINQRQRLWALMDTHTRQPLLYPLLYLIDHLALRSSATQSASLQALKFFYEFWHQKHGVTFCFSFYSSNHNPFIAIDELTAFFHYLENTHFYVPALTIRSTTQTMPQRRTNIRYVHSIIRFIRYLINTYISPRYIDGSPKELTRLATQLTGRLSIHKAEFRTLNHSRQMKNGTTHKRFRSLTAEMVMGFYESLHPIQFQRKTHLIPSLLVKSSYVIF